MDYERLTTGQAAKVAGVSISTLKRKIAGKELKATRSESGEYNIRHEDLMAFLSGHEPSTRAGANGRPPTGRAAEALMSRSEERLEREVEELKLERIRLLAKIDELEREKRAVLAEYHAMTAKILREKEEEIAFLKTGESEKKVVSDKPSRFYSKIKSAFRDILDD
jgi:excisionase family DNA binding protein